MFQTSNGSTFAGRIDAGALAQVKTRFVRNVYTWMAGGLGLTAAAAAMTLQSPALLSTLVFNKLAFYGLIFAELGLVIWLSGWIGRMSVRTASYAFLGYSILNGVTMSVVFLMYTATSIAAAFGVAAGTFAAAAIYGTITKRDLNSIGGYAFMLLIGVIIGSVVNIFLKSTMMYWIITYVSVGIFVALAAYDAQKVQQMGLQAASQGEAALSRNAILAALALYLDFINLFLLMLQIFGQRRD